MGHVEPFSLDKIARVYHHILNDFMEFRIDIVLGRRRFRDGRQRPALACARDLTRRTHTYIQYTRAAGAATPPPSRVLATGGREAEG